MIQVRAIGGGGVDIRKNKDIKKDSLLQKGWKKVSEGCSKEKIYIRNATV